MPRLLDLLLPALLFLFIEIGVVAMETRHLIELVPEEDGTGLGVPIAVGMLVGVFQFDPLGEDLHRPPDPLSIGEHGGDHVAMENLEAAVAAATLDEGAEESAGKDEGQRQCKDVLGQPVDPTHRCLLCVGDTRGGGWGQRHHIEVPAHLRNWRNEEARSLGKGASMDVSFSLLGWRKSSRVAWRARRSRRGLSSFPLPGW